MNKTDAIIDNRSLAATTTILVAMLLISQLSLASSNTKYSSDSNFEYLNVSAPDNDDKLRSSSPDIESIGAKRESVTISQHVDNQLSTIYIENLTASYSIRSPPLFA